jgi:hypothetical protein
MQKRRAHNNYVTGLPLTDADVQRYTKAKPIRTRKKKRKGGGGCWPLLLRVVCASILFALMIGGLFLGKRLIGGEKSTTNNNNDNTRRIASAAKQQEENHLVLPFSQYTSLEYALQHSKLVGLYFAAAWCPMSTPVTNMIDDVLGETLLPPPDNSDEHQEPPSERAPMSLVYVSSDESEEAFEDYQQRRNWIPVPFDSSERTALKKQFSVCAKPEVALLGIDRKFEIPTLLILDGETHGVITTNGAEDLMEYKENALDHWMDLYHLVRAMEEKYAGDGPIQYKSHQQVYHAESVSSLFA